MEIRRALLSIIAQLGRGARPSEPLQPLKALQPGQRLEARVLGQAGPNRILLEMLGRRLVADSSQVTLKAGQQIRLEVVQAGPQPQLKILTAQPDDEPQARALRAALPRQQPLNHVLQTLAQWQADPEIRRHLPPGVRQQLTTLLQSLPDRTDLTHPERLPQILRQSGLLSEALVGRRSRSYPVDPPLSSTTPKPHPSPDHGSEAALTPSTDLKTRLLQLLKSLSKMQVTARPTPPAPATAGPSQAALVPAQPTSPSGQPSPPPTTPAPTTLRSEPPLSPLESQPPTAATAPPPDPTTRFPQPSSPRNPQEAGPPPSSIPVAPHFNPDRPDESLLETLVHKVSAALARIVVDQLASLPQPDSTTLTWHFEIPFHNGAQIDPLRLTIAGEADDKRKRETKPPPWSVDMELAPPGLGKIRVRIVLAGKRISSYLWGEQATTRKLFRQYLSQLEQRFQAVGLHPGQLQVIDAPLPEPRPRPSSDVPLLDEQT